MNANKISLVVTKVNESFDNIAIHQNRFIMKLSSKGNKDKIIELIQKFFDEKFIEEASRKTKFVQRESKLQGLIFFSLCFYGKEGRNSKFGGFMQRTTKGRHRD